MNKYKTSLGDSEHRLLLPETSTGSPLTASSNNCSQLVGTTNPVNTLNQAFFKSEKSPILNTQSQCVKIEPDVCQFFDETQDELMTMSPQFLLNAVVQETNARLDQSNTDHGVGSVRRRIEREWEISNKMDEISGLL